MENSTFTLSQNGIEKFTGTENECYFKLQRLQGQSADWAIKYEGWKIEEIDEETGQKFRWVTKGDFMIDVIPC